MAAYRVYLGISFALAATTGLVYTTVVVYRVDAAGLNPLQLVLVGTVLEAAYFGFQLPTGVLADLGSSRACVVFGVAVLGAGLLVEGAWPTFAGILAAQVVGALGYALVSGALEAWIAGEVGTGDLTRVYLRGSQAGLAGTLLGTAASGPVAGGRLNLPLLTGGALLLATAAVLVVVMPERARTRPDSEPGAVETVRAAWRLIRVRPAFVLVFVVVALVGGWSEAIDRLWGAHLLANHRLPGPDATLWFSLLGVVATLLGLVVTQVLATRTAETLRTLLAIVAALLGTTIVFGLATNVWVAIGAALALAAARTAFAPVLSAWLVERTDPGVRATVLSTRDMFDATGQVLGGPALGAIGTWWSLRAALLAGASALAPAAVLLITARRRLRAATAPGTTTAPRPESTR
ncbi:tetracycline efflux MFS transporter TetA(P) [Cryptosporangium japonicum]|uniref:Tetracycline efflux MFS transporter TetA(P) n=1 Tax=Cryptosporangium japonicum TaxID=80872 RepID=A0ABN0UTA5_9ACTN